MTGVHAGAVFEQVTHHFGLAGPGGVVQRSGAERADFVDIRPGGQEGFDAFHVAGLSRIVQVAGSKRTRHAQNERQPPHRTMVERFGGRVTI